MWIYMYVGGNRVPMDSNRFMNYHYTHFKQTQLLFLPILWVISSPPLMLFSCDWVWTKKKASIVHGIPHIHMYFFFLSLKLLLELHHTVGSCWYLQIKCALFKLDKVKVLRNISKLVSTFERLTRLWDTV